MLQETATGGGVRSGHLGRTVLVGIAIVVLGQPAGIAQTMGDPIRILGAAVDTNNSARTDQIQIDVTRWSTNAETERLIGILQEQGQRDFLYAVQKNPRTGNIRRAGQLGWDLRYASRSPLPEGKTAIVLVTDRPLAFSEIWNQDRSTDYPFIWIQIELNSEGRGEGTMSYATKVIPAGGHDIVLENLPFTFPIKLNGLRSEKLKR
jgi:hypothetical protein